MESQEAIWSMPCFHWGLPANHPVSSFLKDLIHDSRADRGFERHVVRVMSIWICTVLQFTGYQCLDLLLERF